jgi:uncharacterized protein (TIGR03083 family)
MTEIAQYIAVLDGAGDRLARAAATAGLDARVPTCPGWAVRDLVAHVGGVHRWATSYVVTGRAGPTTGDEEAAFFRRPPDSELLSWYAEGHASLVATLGGADPAMSCWAFLPAPSPLAFWARRQAHETAVHCADAEASAGLPTTFPGDFAADGIDELLNGFLARPGGRLVADPPVVVAVRAADTGDCWTVRIEPDRRVVSPGASEADCTLAGRASDLYLLLWNRLLWNRLAPRPVIDVSGDARVLDLWRASATVRWA